ncbi:hypothetical protein DFJ74DRAFT_521864 [Hyaloraphidium curvatum]|nr:hypothetical protein DFJ74DRAFT_521864 [Hyaloraphidium curvatum]
MSEEIEDFQEQLNEITTEISESLATEVSELRGTDRIERCSELRGRLQRARQLLRSIQVEARELESGARRTWEYRAKELEQELNHLQQDIEWAETTGERDDLHAKPEAQLTARDYTQQGLAIQNQSLASTARTKQRIEETINIGTDITEGLKRQTEQITKIKDDVDQIESNIKRADKQVRMFMRRMATDRIFLVLILLVVLGVIAAIVVYFMKPKLEGRPVLGVGTPLGR